MAAGSAWLATPWHGEDPQGLCLRRPWAAPQAQVPPRPRSPPLPSSTGIPGREKLHWRMNHRFILFYFVMCSQHLFLSSPWQVRDKLKIKSTRKIIYKKHSQAPRPVPPRGGSARPNPPRAWHKGQDGHQSPTQPGRDTETPQSWSGPLGSQVQGLGRVHSARAGACPLEEPQVAATSARRVQVYGKRERLAALRTRPALLPRRRSGPGRAGHHNCAMRILVRVRARTHCPVPGTAARRSGPGPAGRWWPVQRFHAG